MYTKPSSENLSLDYESGKKDESSILAVGVCVCVRVCVFASMEPHAATPFRSLTRNHNFSTKSFYVDRIEERNIKRKRQASDVTFKEY
jgi:hypothetical protein